MKIAVISTTVLPCPPPGYGGLEAISYHCAVGLARRGHQVLLVAPNTSPQIPGVEIHGTTQGESEQQAFSGYAHRLINEKFDAVIDHSWWKFAVMLRVHEQLKAPVLNVCHAPANTMYQTAPPHPLPCMVALSKDQAAHISEIWGVPARVAYNGVDLDHYKPTGAPRTKRLLFLARLSTIKGPHIAVDIARQTRVGLDIVGDDVLTGEPQLAQRVRALAVNNIRYHGPCDRTKAVEWFSQAHALIHPAFPFKEPFGLSPVEAQSCEAPVLASDHGALRETVVHGVTGFLCKSPDEMAEYIRTDAVSALDRKACRENASRFSIKAMCDTYERLCQEAVETGGW